MMYTVNEATVITITKNKDTASVYIIVQITILLQHIKYYRPTVVIYTSYNANPDRQGCPTPKVHSPRFRMSPAPAHSTVHVGPRLISPDSGSLITGRPLSSW
jgi:hypothetical protein